MTPDNPYNQLTPEAIEHTQALLDRARANLATHGNHWFTVERDALIAKVRIFGDVGHFSDNEATLHNFTNSIGDAQSVDLTLDSYGGRAKVALGIYELLSTRKTRAVIFGACYSSAYIIALSAQHIAIHPSAKILVHAARRAVFGDARTLIEAAYSLQALDKKVKALMLKEISKRKKSGRLADALERCFELDKPVTLDATEAIEWGFADSLVSETQP